MNWVSKNYFTSPNQLKCQPKLQENLFTHFFGLIKIFVNFSQIVKRQYRCPTGNFYNDFLKSLICLKKNASILKYHRVKFAFSHRVHNAKEFFSLWFAKNDDMCCNPTLAMVAGGGCRIWNCISWVSTSPSSSIPLNMSFTLKEGAKAATKGRAAATSKTQSNETESNFPS